MPFDIHARRQELGLSLEEVGKICGVSKSTVKKWETGYIENMRRDKVALLASALKVSPLEILGIQPTIQEEDLPADAIELAKLISSYPKETQASFMQLFQLLSRLPPDMQQAYPALLAAALKAQGLIE